MKAGKELIILGIDPGTTVTGYGLIKFNLQQLTLIDYGSIRPPAKFKLSDRYLVIFDAMLELLDRYSPQDVAVETQYVKHNPQSAIKLGMARGVVIVAAKKSGKRIFEYAPSKAKLAVTGLGNASKYQIQGMMQRLFHLQKEIPEDAADALAIAICHSHALQTARVFGEEI